MAEQCVVASQTFILLNLLPLTSYFFLSLSYEEVEAIVLLIAYPKYNAYAAKIKRYAATHKYTLSPLSQLRKTVEEETVSQCMPL